MNPATGLEPTAPRSGHTLGRSLGALAVCVIAGFMLGNVITAAGFESPSVGTAPAGAYVQVTLNTSSAVLGTQYGARAQTAGCAVPAKSFLWKASVGRVIAGAGTPTAGFVFDQVNSPEGTALGVVYATAVDGSCAGLQGRASTFISATPAVAVIPPELQDEAIMKWLGDQTVRHLIGVLFRNARSVARHAKGEAQ